MRRRQPRPSARLTVTAEPVVRAGAETTVGIDATEGTVRVSLRLLGWDMRSAQKWLLAEVPAGSHRVEIPAGLAPGCARMTEYAIFAELVGQRVAAAAPVRLVSDHVFALDGASASGAIELDADAVTRGGTVSGRVRADSVEVGAELHSLGATTAPRFLAVATVAPGADGAFAATLPHDIPPTLSDGEELAIVWTVRAGDAYRRFAVVDPDGAAGERRPALLTFLAQLARDPFAFRAG